MIFVEMQESEVFVDFMKNQVFRPREDPEYIRNDNKYVGFWAGGRGGDGNPPFSLIFTEFYEI